MHRALERLDLSLPLEALRPRAQNSALEALDSLTLVEPEAARSRVRELVDRFFDGRLLSRRLEIGDQAASEVPTLMDASALSIDAVSHVSGIIDLLYTDPASGDWVVADYKTDVVADEAELEALRQKYAGQGWVYAHAVQHALSLPNLPRFELWLLDAGRIVEVAPLHSPSP